MGFKVTTHSGGVSSRPLREASAEEMQGVVLRSWSQSSAGSLVLYDSDCWSQKDPWRPSWRPCPHCCRLGSRGLGTGSGLPKLRRISGGTGRDLNPGPQSPTRSPDPLSIHKLLTSFIHFPSTHRPYVLTAVVCMVKYDFSGFLRW